MELRVLSSPEDLTCLALEGRLDIQGTRAVEPEFASHIAAQGKPAVIDLAGVTFLGSIAMRMLVSTAKSLSRQGYRLVLFNPRDNVRKALEFAGLAQILHIAVSEGDARRIARGTQQG